MLLILTVITGIIYPLLVTGISQVFFAKEAKGSVILKDGKAVGSELIGQPFDDPKYFWGRLSATGPHPYNAASSSGSNLGPTNQALIAAVQGRLDALRKADSTNTQAVPFDLVTTSGSGLDPHITPAAAFYQVPRIARARGLNEALVKKLVETLIEERQWGFLGEPRVNVLRLNLALDTL